MVCDGCMTKNQFLSRYVNALINTVVDVEGTATISVCKLAQEVTKTDKGEEGKVAAYFSEGWRSQLCRCEQCLVTRP